MRLINDLKFYLFLEQPAPYSIHTDSSSFPNETKVQWNILAALKGE